MGAESLSSWYGRVRHPFWNRSENRIRALWRILGALIGVFVVSGVVNAILIRPLDAPLAGRNLASNGIIALVAVGLWVVWARYVDRRDLRAYGFRLDERWWRMLGLGVLVALIGWGGALVTSLALGWASVASTLSPGTGDLPFAASFVAFVVGWVFVGIWEELVFRGIVMRNAIEGLDFEAVSYRTALVGGWVVSSVLFGVLHADQATSALALGFWILAGLVLGLAYLLTDQLAFPIGLHFAFDFGVNNVFGLASVREAGRDAPTLVRPAFTGPETFVGLSGVVNTVWLVLIGVLAVGVVGWQYGSVEPRIDPYSGDGSDGRQVDHTC